VPPAPVPPPSKCIDVPGQSCNGFVAPYPPVTSTVQTNFNVEGKYTTVKTLTVVGLPAQSALKVTCATPALHGCPFTDKIRNSTKAQAKLPLAPLFKGRRLPTGTRIELRIVAPLAVGRDLTLTTVDGALPRTRTRCISPTTGKIITCPAGGYLAATPTTSGSSTAAAKTG
jgi:hypothetical protein